MKIGYIRSNEQDEDYKNQRNTLLGEGCERIFEDLEEESQLSELEHLLDFARPEDKIYVYQLDRFGLNIKELMRFLDTLIHKNIHIHSILDRIDTASPEGKLLLKIFGVLNQCEQKAICERLSSLDSNVKPFTPKRERPTGRPRGLTKEAEEKAETAAAMYLDKNMNVRDIAKTLDISVATLYSYLKHQNVFQAPEAGRAEARSFS